MNLLPLSATLLLTASAPALPQEAGEAPESPPPGVPGWEQSVTIEPDDPGLDGRLRVVHWPGAETRAERVIRTLVQEPDLPGIPSAHPALAFIFLAPDQATWEALTGGRVPHWGAGVAIPSLGRIVLPVFQTPWDGFQSEARTVRHEWAHLALHDYLSGLRIPRWFDEGYAQWAAGGWDLQEAWRLRLALAGGNAPPLDSLTLAWPRDRAGAEVAYLLAATAVEYLVREGGPNGMEVFLRRWQETGSFETAFRRTFGFTTGAFEERWIEYVKGRYGWLLMLGQSTVLWLLLGLGLVVLFRIRRRRDRERMARLRAHEPPELPAYWRPPQHPPIGGFREDAERARRRDGSMVDRSSARR